MSGGGGSTTTNTQDKEYNRRMATIAEEQQGMYEEMMNFYKYGTFESPNASSAAIERQAQGMISGGIFNWWDNAGSSGYTVEGSGETYESRAEALAAAKELVASNPKKYGIMAEPTYGGSSYADMERAQIEANMELIPSQTEAALAGTQAEKAQYQAAEKVAPVQAKTSIAQLNEQRNIINERQPVIGEYFDEATRGYNPEQYANRFGAEAANEFTESQRLGDLRMSALGAEPGSTRSVAMQNEGSAQRALAVSSAKNTGRDYATDKRYERLGAALGGL